VLQDLVGKPHISAFNMILDYFAETGGILFGNYKSAD
jgi:hypothetical protein